VTEAHALRIAESSQIGAARRLAAALAGRLGFSETERGKVAIVVTEAASNLVEHAREGELLLRALEQDGIAGIEIMTLDRGPGMANPDACMQDGYSTAGTAGHGLGAMARLSGQFDLYTAPGLGTALLARLWSRRRRTAAPRPAGLHVGAVCLPLASEAACGDAWMMEETCARSRIVVADGLGHGVLAADASQAALRAFAQHPELGPGPLLEQAHRALQGTRGAAMAVAAVERGERRLRFAGVGNIAGRLITAAGSSGLVSHNGTVGHALHRVQEFDYPWPDGALLVLHSDGLESRWRLDGYPGLASRDPSLIAGALYRDFRRERDDVTVLVAREAREEDAAP
jgi:anti-sigma regulatory factor (Ser/Thr protein kinase)